MTPLSVALIGCGNRAQNNYMTSLIGLKEFLNVTAVCDPNPEHGQAGADMLGATYYDSLTRLAKDKPMEAAVVVTPLLSHHAVSCYLSSHGIHNLVETSIAPTLTQAREMVDTAGRHGVYFRIAEQFFRDHFDIISRAVIEANVIGDVHRMTNFHAHTGYHNNSRHQVFAGGSPLAVNSIEHYMPTMTYVNTGRPTTGEMYHQRSFHFANGMLINDLAGNAKGALGRYARPGLIEIDGTQGTIVQEAVGDWTGSAEVRLVPEENVNYNGYTKGYPIVYEYRNQDGSIEDIQAHPKSMWYKMYPKDKAFVAVRVDLPDQTIRIENEFLKCGVEVAYHAEIAEHLKEFAQLVRTGSPDRFTPDMALMSLIMDLASTLSVERQGARVEMNDPDIGKTDEEKLAAIEKELGVDPMDVQAMVDYSFPRV